MATAVYITASLDLQIKADTDISVATTVLDSGGNAYSFGNKTDSDLNIYDYVGGTVLKNYGESATEGLSYASNVVTWNGAWPNLNLPRGFYYYEITYEDSATANPTQKIVDGTLEVL